MDWLTDALQRVGLLPAFTADDMLNAEIESELVDHRKVLDELTAATILRRQATVRLRDVLREASRRAIIVPHLDHQGD